MATLEVMTMAASSPSSTRGTTTSMISAPISTPTSASTNGKKKKKKKKLSKSERKRRKLAREFQELQEQEKKPLLQSPLPPPLLQSQPPSQQKPQQQQSQDNDKDEKGEKRKDSKLELSSSHEKKGLIDESKQEKQNEKSDNFLALSINNYQNNESSTSSLSNLLEFVFPKPKKKKNENALMNSNSYSNTNKSYIHSKLRKKSSHGTNKTGEGSDNDKTNMEKQKAISFGVADASIDDIFSPKKKKKKEMEMEKVGTSTNTPTTKKEEEDKEKETSHDNNNNNDNEEEESSASDDISSDPDDSSKEEEGSRVVTTPNTPTSITTTQKKLDESQTKNMNMDMKSNNDIKNDDESIKECKSPNSITTTTTSSSSSSSITAKRKRSMSEDSSNHDPANSHLSGISVEMAVKDRYGRRPRCNSTDGELNLPRRGLCDEQKVMGFHKWDMNIIRPSLPRGFHNLGNTCFLNATLQCLAHLPTFCQCVANIDPSKDRAAGNNMKHMNGQKKGRLSNGQMMTLALRQLLQNVHGLKSKNAPKQSPISPKSIVNSISLIDGSNRGYKFRPGRQEDAHEFLVHLLDAMNDGELVGAGINQKKSGWRERLPIARLDETTFVHRMFGGYLRSQVCCTKCDFKSNTYDPFLDLSLEISSKKVTSVYTALKEYTRKETLDTANKWKCSGCKRKVCATKQLTCFRPPLSLCIQLKRFSFGDGMGGYMHHQYGSSHFAGKGMGMRKGGSKIQKAIEFPAELKLPLSDGRKCEYELTGIVIHVGHSATSGHYTAYIRRPMKTGSQWFHMDDSFVEPVKEKTVLRQRDAYLLFYCRKEVKLNLPNPPSIFANAEEAMQAGEDKARTKAKLEDKSEASNEESPCKSTSQPLQKEMKPKVRAMDQTSNVDQKVQTPDKMKTQPTDLEKVQHEEVSKVANKELKNKSPSSGQKSKQDKKALTLDHGSKHGSVQVLVRKLKRKKPAWKPSSSPSNNNGNGLLANISKWDDDDDGPKNTHLRDAVFQELKQEQKKRKRKMYLDSWNAGLDEGRTKKVKEKLPTETYKQLDPSQNQFHRIQNSLMQMKGKGKGNKHSLKKRRMRK